MPQRTEARAPVSTRPYGFLPLPAGRQHDIYQVPGAGMAVQASWGGTVYTVDSALQ